MIVILIILSIAYAFLMARFAEGFQKVPEFDFSEQGPKGSFSILIPFRNEENHLPMLLDSLNAIQYSRTLFEVIFIDDDSTDASVKIIQKTLSGTNISYQIIRNHRVSNSPKKDAIETAIKIAKHEWILTTDADCILPDNWLQVFNEYTTSIDSKMIVGPVIYKTNDSFIENFQLFEFLSLQGATIGGFGIGKPFLCNGAKSSSSKLWFGTYVGILVFLTNLSWILAVINLFLFRENFLKLIVPIAIKIMVDYYFLDIISRFYKNQIKIKSYIFSSLFYPFFSTFIVFKTLSSKYNWKDRRFKK